VGEGGGAKAEVSVKVEARPGLGYCTARATVAVVDLAAVAEATTATALGPCRAVSHVSSPRSYCPFHRFVRE
jgi:hypothetical protein